MNGTSLFSTAAWCQPHTGIAGRCRALTLAALLLCPGIAMPSNARASDGQRADDVLYVELLGSGGILSVNYERMLGADWALRAGIGWIGATGGTVEPTVVYLGAPLLVEYLGIGTANHHLELGLGLVPTLTLGDEKHAHLVIDTPPVIAVGVVGYRYQRPDGGFMLRAGFTPLVGGGDVGFSPWPGLSLGVAF